MDEVDYSQLAQQELEKRKALQEAALIDQNEPDYTALAQDALKKANVQPESPEPDYAQLAQAQLAKDNQKEELGWIDKANRGVKTGREQAARRHQQRLQTLDALLADREPEIFTPEKMNELSFDPEHIAEWLTRTGVGMAPGLAATSAGTIAGGSAGASVGGPWGGAIGAIAGGGGMAATFAGGEQFADAYQEARLRGASHEKAIEHAKESGTAAASFAALLGPMGRFGAKDAFGKYLAKQIGANVATSELENTAQNALAKKNIDAERGLTKNWKEAAVSGVLAGSANALTRRGIEVPEIPDTLGKNSPPGGLGGPHEPHPSGTRPQEKIIKGERVSSAAPHEHAPKSEMDITLDRYKSGFEQAKKDFTEVFDKKASLQDLLQHGDLSEDLIPTVRDQIAELDKKEAAIRDDIRFYNETIPAWERNKEQMAARADAENKETEAFMESLRKNENEPKKNTNEVPPSNEPPKQPPSENPPAEQPPEKDGPPAVIPPEKPKVPSTRVEKETTGERLNPDMQNIRDKLFYTGEPPPPAERGIVDKALRGLSEAWHGHGIETSLYDWQTPIKIIGRRATGATRESENRPLRTARATLHIPGTLNAFMRHGVPMYHRGQKRLDVKPKTKGLMQILEPALKSTDMANKFKTYLAGVRIEKGGLAEQGRERNISAAEASAAVALGDAHPEFKIIANGWQSFNEAVADFRVQSGMVSQENRDMWDDSSYVPFYKYVGEGAGNKSAKGALAGQKPNIHGLTGGGRQYLVIDRNNNPILRTRSAREAYALSRRHPDSVVHDVGPPNKDIFGNMINNTIYGITSGMKNIAAQESIRAAIQQGIAHRVANNTVARRRADGELIASAYFNGRERSYQITDPTLHQALTIFQPQSPKEIDNVKKLLQTQKQWFTNNIMGDVAIVMGINIKDFMRTITLGKDKLGISGVLTTMPKNYLAALLHETKLRVDPRLVKIMAAGGDSTLFRKTDKELLKELMDKAAKADGTLILPAWYKAIIPETYKGLRKMVQGIGNVGAKGNALTFYDAAKQAGLSDAEAVFEAMDLMDYGVQGSSKVIQYANQIIPFLKPMLQGMHKFKREMGYTGSSDMGGNLPPGGGTPPPNGFSGKAWRYAKNNRTAKNLMKLATMASMNALINLIPDDDKETEANGFNTKPEWAKNLYSFIDIYKYAGLGSTKRGKENIKTLEKEADIKIPRWIQIPKFWLEGQVGMGAPERITNILHGKSDVKNELSQMGLVAFTQLYMNPFPPIFMETFSQFSGHDFFRQAPIVPRSQENLEPGEQYGADTSGTAKWLGKKIGYSPRKIDHAIKNLGGNLTSYVAMIPDAFDGNASAKKDWYEGYFFKKYFGGELSYNNALVNEMYEAAHAAQVAVTTLKKYETDVENGVEGASKQADIYEAENADRIDLGQEIEDDKKEVREIEDELRVIKENKKLSSDDKKLKSDKLIRERNLILMDMKREIVRFKEAQKRNKKQGK